MSTRLEGFAECYASYSHALRLESDWLKPTALTAPVRLRLGPTVSALFFT